MTPQLIALSDDTGAVLPMTSSWLMLAIFFLVACGLVVFASGKKLPLRGLWLLWLALVLVVAGSGMDSGLFFGLPSVTKAWLGEWILPHEELGAVSFGIIHDKMSEVMSVLVALITGLLLLKHPKWAQAEHAYKIYSGLAFSTAGVILAWNSLTLWIGFVGGILTLLGGAIALSCSAWPSEQKDLTLQFIWEKSAGFFFAFLGAAVLAGSRPGLFLTQASSLPISEGNSSLQPHATVAWVGSSLLVLGLFSQAQSFPYLGWMNYQYSLYLPVRVLLSQIFPFWAAFALFLRFQPQLVTLGFLPPLSWFALGSSLLTLISGFCQHSWQQSFGALLSAGFALVFAILASGQPTSAGLSLFLGISLGGLTFLLAGEALDGSLEVAEAETKSSHQRTSLFLKLACGLGVAAMTGFFGFVSAQGGLDWVGMKVHQPIQKVFVLLVFFLFVVLAWRIFFQIKRLRAQSPARLLTFVALFILLLLSSGLLWSGSLSGGVLLNHPDQLFSLGLHSLLAGRAEWNDFDDYLSASGLYWGVMLLAFLTAGWTSSVAAEKWGRANSFFPKARQFLKSGYQIQELYAWAMKALIVMGLRLEFVVSTKIWDQGMSRGLWFCVSSVASSVQQIDQWVFECLELPLVKGVDLSSKLLQLIQTGDVRWYLLFGLGVGFGLLAHFLTI